jgi:hypothetical protein
MVLVFNSMAFIFIIVGAYIWKTGAFEMIKSLVSGEITDPKALARCVGINLIVMGLLILSGNFLGVLFPKIPMIFKLGLETAVIGIFTILAMRQCRKYEQGGK